jgi:two-component sensor histidine kinase
VTAVEAASERRRLLYIDDDAGLCRLVSRGMERRDFAVTAVQDGASGVRLAEAGRFDVVAVDHYMPGQDGLETLGQILDLPEPPPVVYVTASDESRLAVAALKAGAADYVVKSAADDFQDLLANALTQAIDGVRLRRERDAAQQALAAANERLEAVVHRQAALLREVNHRVANSLQLIASLVHLQAGALDDEAAKAALHDTQARIAAVMQVHRRLYTSDDVQNVDMEEYLGGLVGELQQSLAAAAGTQHPIRLKAEPIKLNPDKAVSLGVVVAELVTNAFKYAYPAGEAGEVRVALQSAPADQVRLTVEDDGQGLGEKMTARGTGLGQRVIAAMARSLNSKLEYDTSHRGARAVLAFQA